MKNRITCLLTYSFITGTASSIFKVIFNLFLRDYDLSNTAVGNIASAQLWGSAILGLIISLLADLVGRKKILVLSVILNSFSGTMMVFCTDPTLLWWFSLLNGGFGIVGFTVIAASITLYTSNNSRAKVFGLNTGIIMGSGVLGNFLGGIMGDFLGFRRTLMLSMLIYATALIPLLKIKTSVTKSSLKEIFDFSGFDKDQKKVLFFYFTSTVLVGFGAGLFVNFGNLIFKDLFNLNTTNIGIALSLAQLGTAIGASMCFSFGKKYGPLKFSLVMRTLVVPLMLSLVVIRKPVLFTILYALRFVFMNMTNPIMNSIVFSYMPREKLATISGVNSLFNNSVRAIAAIMFGYIVGSSIDGYKTLFTISTVFYAFSALVVFIFYKNFENKAAIKALYN